jgi:hypothetical protein
LDCLSATSLARRFSRSRPSCSRPHSASRFASLDRSTAACMRRGQTIRLLRCKDFAVKSTRGNCRVLTDAQVQRVLDWNMQIQAWNELRKQVPTHRAFAKANKMDPDVLLSWLSTLDQRIELLVRIRDWNRAFRALLSARAKIDTLRGLAREFGVSETTIQNCVRRKGEYKQASPERIAETRALRRVRLNRLRRLNLY